MLKDNKIVKLIEKEVLTNSFKISCIIRCLFIAGGLKDYILVILNIPFFHFFFSSVIFNGFFALIYAGIGCEFDEIEKFMKNPKNFQQKSFTEKICLFFIFFSIALSFVFFGLVSCWFRKKFKEQNAKDEVNKIKEVKKGEGEESV